LFGFLREALTYNVKQALAKRGGFKEVATGPIEIELKFRDLEATSSKVTYLLVIDQVKNRPVVKREVLNYRRGRNGGLRHFLDFSLGKGKVIINDKDSGKAKEKSQEEKLVSEDILALNGLGSARQEESINPLAMMNTCLVVVITLLCPHRVCTANTLINIMKFCKKWHNECLDSPPLSPSLKMDAFY